MCATATAGCLSFTFWRTAEIGGSQKARLRAPEHAMTHGNEKKHTWTYMLTHEKAAWHAHARVACATGAQRFLCASRQETRFYPRASGLGGLKYTCTHTQLLNSHCACLAKRPLHAQMHRNWRMLHKRQNCRRKRMQTSSAMEMDMIGSIPFSEADRSQLGLGGPAIATQR